MKTAILGWYGHNSIGDEAVLEGIQHLLAKHLDCHEFHVMTSTETPAVPRFSSEDANDCDLFILGGGELISPTRVWMDEEKWHRQVTIPKAIAGCGINGEDVNSNVLAELRDFTYVGVRDQYTYNRLRALRPHLTFDPSLVLARKHGVRWNPEDSITAGIVPTERKTFTRGEGVTNPNIVNESTFHLEQKLRQDRIQRVRLFAFGEEDNDDYETCEKLARRLRRDFEVSISKPDTPEEALRGIAECSRIYAYRLHGMLFAYSLNAPFTYYGYHSKLRRNYDTIKNLAPSEVLVKMDDAWHVLSSFI